MNPIFFIYT